MEQIGFKLDDRGFERVRKGVSDQAGGAAGVERQTSEKEKGIAERFAEGSGGTLISGFLKV